MYGKKLIVRTTDIETYSFSRNIIIDANDPPPGLPRLQTMGVARTTTLRYRHTGKTRTGDPRGLFQFTLSGRGELRRRGKTYPVGDGRALLVPLPDDHEYYLPEDSGHWEFIFLIFRIDEFAQGFKRLFSTAGPVVNLPEDGAGYRELFALYRMLNDETAEPPRLDIHIQLMRLLASIMEPSRAAPDDAQQSAVRLALRFIEINYAQPLTVERIAEECGIGVHQLIRAFPSVAGTTPAKYVTQTRLKAAATLLASTDAPVKRIALDCGYATDNYFCKDFRRLVGISPGAYRKENAERPGATLRFR
ncbi:MAG: AraC family transcriptional regulator [Planctomycetota bacterium]